MLNYIDVSSDIKPPVNRPLIAYCPGWNTTGYSVVTWNGVEFDGGEMHGTDIDPYVEKWAIFMEVG